MMQLAVVVKFITTTRVIIAVLTINQIKLLLITPRNSKKTRIVVPAFLNEEDDLYHIYIRWRYYGN